MPGGQGAGPEVTGGSLGCRTVKQLLLDWSLFPQGYNLSILAEPKRLEGACPCEDVLAWLRRGAGGDCLLLDIPPRLGSQLLVSRLPRWFETWWQPQLIIFAAQPVRLQWRKAPSSFPQHQLLSFRHPEGAGVPDAVLTAFSLVLGDEPLRAEGVR